jgi:uncharacterized protein
MGLNQMFFFDTYAFFEVLNGNPGYSEYLKGKIVTTRLNLLELHYCLLRHLCIEYGDTTIKKASILKNNLKKRRLSYIDCIGYVIAKTLNIKFLTGDKQFEDLENVEFVK